MKFTISDDIVHRLANLSNEHDAVVLQVSRESRLLSFHFERGHLTRVSADLFGPGGGATKCPHPGCDMGPGQHAHFAGDGIGGNSSGGGTNQELATAIGLRLDALASLIRPIRVQRENGETDEAFRERAIAAHRACVAAATP